eukprot:m.174413 g.174413  ORF g.174413 m.174413 type:complete len:95 (-) comp16538_c2_seq21:1337-1621(-)
MMCVHVHKCPKLLHCARKLFFVAFLVNADFLNSFSLLSACWSSWYRGRWSCSTVNKTEDQGHRRHYYDHIFGCFFEETGSRNERLYSSRRKLLF